MGVETGLPTAPALDPAAVLAAHLTAWAAIWSGAKAQTASRPRDAVVNVLPPYMLFPLAVAGMEGTEKGPGITLSELEMLRDKMTGRLEALGPGEAVRGPQPGVWTAFAAKYTDRQRGPAPGAWRSPERCPGEGWRSTRMGSMRGSRCSISSHVLSCFESFKFLANCTRNHVFYELIPL